MPEQSPHLLRYLYCLDCGADVRVDGLRPEAERPAKCLLCGSSSILSALGAMGVRQRGGPGLSKGHSVRKGPND